MSEIKHGGLDQYGTGPFKQQQFGTVCIEGVNIRSKITTLKSTELLKVSNPVSSATRNAINCLISNLQYKVHDV